MEPSVIVIALDGPLARDIAALCERVLESLGDGTRGRVVCDVAGLTTLDLTVVDALARLQLEARRSGRRLYLRGASPELMELLTVTGLIRALPRTGRLRVEPGRQTEEWKERRGVQEEGDPGDPVA